MMMMMKLVVAVSCVVAASFLVAAADASHYEKPPCGSDEKAVQIAGVNGIFCSPECTPTGSCPTDVPAGVVAKPTCALSAPTGEKFCAILCSPRMDEETEKDVGDGECGPDMSCSAIPGAQGFGICDYAAAAAVSATTLRGDSNSVVTTMQYSPADAISAASA